MAARRDGDGIAEVDLGLAVMIVDGDGCKAAQHVQLRDSLRRLLDAGGFPRDKLPQRHKQVVFQRHNAVLGRQNGAFQFFEFFRDVPFAGRERLLADIAVRDQIQLALCDLDIIAEHAVISHAQVPDAGLFLFAGLDLREHPLAAGLDGAQLIELFVRAVADETALAQQKRRIVHDGRVDLLLEICQRVKLLKKRLQIRRTHPGQPLLDGGKTRRALRKRGKIAAGGCTRHNAGHGALKVRNFTQGQNQFLAVDGLFDQLLHGGQTARDLRGAEKRPLHPRPQQTAAHGGLRLVEHPEKAPALFLCAHRLRQFEIPPRGKIELHELACNI